MASKPRFTSKAEGFRTTEEIAALRPVREYRRPVRPPGKKPRGKIGTLCPICGAPFYDMAEFGQHVWVEGGGVIKESNQRKAAASTRAKRRYATDPEFRARKAAQSQQWRADHPERFRELTQRWRTEHPRGRAMCDVCGKSIRSEHMARHKRRMHGAGT